MMMMPGVKLGNESSLRHTFSSNYSAVPIKFFDEKSTWHRPALAERKMHNYKRRSRSFFIKQKDPPSRSGR
ncbi:hypothetical protein MPTK1_8g17880 [Marchantia polymorpha subsp. ruderalis]|uniref:Uncharacterized protein n=1 Tax=Marchantia polymorpha TaxID=3197 RepID=A0A2R6X8H5_MARPO|nr:hypothetical protein MARPO_0030s0122 [Marchantia polymorpha]BBN20279.1 hypothetical protein Mp_8g17880 [Marchantia polymorpha subsp. ruderalis]|eukprot:PTQ42398.1 hypothetical protein MARPO_0030s0122 [Marchantia polymorpha]